MKCKAEIRNGNPYLELTAKTEKDQKVLDKIAQPGLRAKWRLCYIPMTKETELDIEFKK